MSDVKSILVTNQNEITGRTITEVLGNAFKSVSHSANERNLANTVFDFMREEAQLRNGDAVVGVKVQAELPDRTLYGGTIVRLAAPDVTL